MAQLGRVLREEDLSGPRGPDARLKITVPAAWLDDEAWLEVVLPRTLSCAACDGGGCDACGRSGGVDTRGRKELPEVVEVRLPKGSAGATLRLPKRGGLPLEPDAAMSRGILLLTVVTGAAATDGVTRREVAIVAAPEVEAPLARPLPPPRPLLHWVLLGAAVLALAVLLYALTR